MAATPRSLEIVSEASLQQEWRQSQDEDYRTQEDECDEINEENWKIDVEDEEEFGDAAVCANEDNDEEERPRSKSRLLWIYGAFQVEIWLFFMC